MARESYYNRMLEYYDGAKYNFDYDSLRQEAKQQEIGWMAPLYQDACQQFETLRVLDLACGIGKWCRRFAPVARSIVGCDVSEKLLAIAREATDAPNVSYQCDDAMSLTRIEGEFDACFHYNFFNHVPQADWLRFLDTLHARLGAGKLVIMGAQQLTAARRNEILTWIDELPDPVQSNPRGQTNYYIVEHTFDEPLLRVVLQNRARDLRYAELATANGKGRAWYASYRVP
jgi:2-polyprenyl-3-methyl-5-hydroxy-6-metoxy-1,4-benzoquinol methylase